MDAMTGPPLDVLIVGAGISGIGLGAHLVRQCPGRTFEIFERRERIGGTWDLFRYPGVRSDSDMYTLGYEFEPWRDGKSIAQGATILSYLEGVAANHGLPERIRHGRAVVSADWDSAAGLWTVTWRSNDGTFGTTRARFVFFGAGYYDQDDPYDAQIAGLGDFAGPVVHPQHWPQDLDFAGKRVVVIGSGATAATLVPALAESAASVVMLQRTPTWYVTQPSRDRIANLLRRVLPARWAYALTRAKNTRLQNMFIKRSRRKPHSVARFLHGQIRNQLGEAYEADHFTPPYNPWEQRLCLIPDGDLFTAIRDGRAEIVTGQIERVDSQGIRLADCRFLDADIVVTATGLKLAVLGNTQVSLDGVPVDFSEHFYYRNCMFSNVPNLAALFGYLNAGWTLRVDMVSNWLCRLFTQMDAWDMQVATPILAEDHELEEQDLLWGFSSGHLQRSRHLLPKSATQPPWQLSMDYFADREQMRSAPIDDGVMRFERAPKMVAAD